MSITREDLVANGFKCTDERDFEEVWESQRSPSGQWLVVQITGAFRGEEFSWELHTVLQVESIAEPAALGAMMRELGIPTGRAD